GRSSAGPRSRPGSTGRGHRDADRGSGAQEQARSSRSGAGAAEIRRAESHRHRGRGVPPAPGPQGHLGDERTEAPGRVAMSLLVKRGLDLVLSAVLLVLLSPILAAIALMIWLTMGRPVLFVQERPGLHGKIFRIYKFRTMREERDPAGTPLPDGDR